MFFLWKGEKVSLSGDFNETLSFSARDFVNRGWSVIPLKGDLSEQAGKSPAISSWKQYQRRLPTESELNHWFVECRYPAMGIVLGEISGLAVIDIDVPEQARMFQQYHPDLVDTFTVRSGNRGLPHYYFQIPQGMSVPSRYGGGVELRSTGQYVVAPGIRMDGKIWTVVNDRAPRVLTELDLRRILGFLDPETRKIAAGAGNPRPDANLPVPESQSRLFEIGAEVTVTGLQKRYRRLARRLGRNNAIFSVAVFARDRGWTRERVERALVDAHVVQPPRGPHPQESPVQRRQEAQRTIASVFGRPPHSVPRRQPDRRSLPNAMREKLLQLGLGRVARVLDGLLMAGFEFGQQFTAAQAYAAVSRFGIGRNTVFAVLKTVLDGGSAIFRDLAYPSPLHPPTHHANAANRCAEQTKPCLFGRVADSVKRRGRPAARFVMPAIEWLCGLLGVRSRAGDALLPEDLESLASYRAALHAALIRRAPGKYPRKWQARRLGISKYSCRRYEKKTGVQVQPTYRTWALSWGNLEKVVPDELEMGHFLEDERGKRYPPLRVIARKMLAQGKRLLFKSQDANYYELRERDALPEWSYSVAPVPAQKAALSVAPWRVRALKPCREVQKALTMALEMHANDQTAIEIPLRKCLQSALAQKQPLVSDERPANAVNPDAVEACVDRLYNTLRNLNPQRSITRKKANQLVNEFGVSQVEDGLQLLLKRRNVRNPAGFMRVLLRSQQSYG